jgi:hypothetical protein
LNTILPTEPEDAAQRLARHQRMLAELQELGMQLARATAARALADLAQPDPPEEAEEPEPEPHPAPLPAEPRQETAPATPRRTPTRPTAATNKKPPDPVTAFIRLAAAICELIALEAQITAGPAPIRGQISPQLRADPRRLPLIEALNDQIKKHPDRTALRRQIASFLDTELTADPDQEKDASEFFFVTLNHFDIEVDYNLVPDLLLGYGPVATDADYPPDHPIWRDPLIPRAAYPP